MKHKLNFSIEHKNYLKKQKFDAFLIITIRVLIVVLFFLGWELLTYFKVLDPFIVSSPSRMWKTIVNLSSGGQLWVHVGTTLFETVIGFLISTLVGTFVAILLWFSDRCKKILEPYLVVLNSLPKIALGPIIIIWFGANIKAIILMCVLISIILTTISMLNSFVNCDKNKVLLLQSMGASKFCVLFKLILPNSFVDLITVLKINVGLSWVGSIMGEYLVSKKGLGYLIVYGGQVFKLDLVMASTLILCVLAGLMYVFVSILEKQTLKRFT